MSYYAKQLKIRDILVKNLPIYLHLSLYRSVSCNHFAKLNVKLKLKSMRKSLLLSLALLFTASMAFAQDRTVSGKVTSAEDGSGVPGVNVVVKGSTTGAVTDIDGNYKFTIPADGGILVFSFIGLETQEIEIGNRSVIDVQMASDVQQLTEVVVTGSAPGITSRTVGYSIASIDEDLISKAPGIDAAAALQGKVAGVKIVQSGAPGSEAAIRLRGSSSLFESQQPLVIVDGTIINGGLSTINSEDIETMEVLKSSSAAAVYGSRGANGVIVITTRRGDKMKDGEVNIVFRNEVGQNFLPGRVDLANVHHYEVDPATGNPPLNAGGLVPKADQLMNVPYIGAKELQDEIFANNLFYTNYLAITGRSGAMNYMVSAQNVEQPGVVVLKEGQNRKNFKANLDFDVVDKLRITTSNFFSTTDIDNSASGIFFDVLLFRPDISFNEMVPHPTKPGELVLNAKPDSSQQMVNPLYTLGERSNTTNINRYIGSFGLNYAPLDWLTVEGFVGLDQAWLTRENIVPLGYLADDVAFTRINVGGMDYETYNSSLLTSRANLLFARQFGDLSVSARVGYWYEKLETEYFQTNGDQFVFGDVPVLTNLTTITNTEQAKTRTESQNAVIQIGAVYKDKISLDLLGRRDWVSLFGPEERTKNNYRVAASYRLTEDLTIPGIQELKVRVSRATAGVWPRFSAQYETFNITSGVASKGTLGNTALKPASAEENEIGVNVNFLNRFSLDFTYVDNKTKDQIILVPLPAVAGYANQWQNAGDLNYNGFEITLGANIMNSEKFRWDASVNFDTYNQTIENLGRPEFRRGTGIQQSDVFLIKEGEPLGAIYATRWMRSLDEVLVGDETANLADFVINDEGYVVRTSQIGTANEVPLAFVDADGATVHKVGDTNADFNMGFNSTFTFDNSLTIYFLFDWKQGGDIYSQTLQFLTRDNRAGYMDQTGKANPKPIGYYQAFYNTNNPSSFFVYDGSYLKLRELSATYSLPIEKLGNLGNVFKEITFGVIGRNIFTVSDYPGYDPEVGQGTTGDLGSGSDNLDGTTYAVDGFRYPNFRTFSGSLKLVF